MYYKIKYRLGWFEEMSEENEGLNARQSAIKMREDMHIIRASIGGVFAKAWNDFIKDGFV